MFNFYPISSKIILRINSKSHCLKKKKNLRPKKKREEIWECLVSRECLVQNREREHILARF